MAVQFPPPRKRSYELTGWPFLFTLIVISWLAVIGLLYVVTKILNLIGVL